MKRTFGPQLFVVPYLALSHSRCALIRSDQAGMNRTFGPKRYFLYAYVRTNLKTVQSPLCCRST